MCSLLPTPSDILHVDNLWQLCNLVRLQLDNNIIEQISGLEALTKLEWLGIYMAGVGLGCQW